MRLRGRTGAACLGAALLLLMARGGAGPQDISLGNPPSDYVDVINGEFFQKTFNLKKTGSGIASTFITVPAGMVAVIEHITVEASAGVYDFNVLVQNLRGVQGNVKYIGSARIPVILLSQGPGQLMPLGANQSTRAYATSGLQIKMQYVTRSQGETRAWGFISGRLAPEK